MAYQDLHGKIHPAQTHLRVSGSTYSSLYTSIRTQLHGQNLLTAKIDTIAHETQVLQALMTIPARFEGVFKGMSTSRVEGVLLHFAHKCVHNHRRGGASFYKRAATSGSSKAPTTTTADQPPKARHVEQAPSTITGHPRSARREAPPPVHIKTESSVAKEDYLAFQLATYGRPNLPGLHFPRSDMSLSPNGVFKSSFAKT